MRRGIPLLILFALVISGCGKKSAVGSKELTDIKEQEQKQRLGEILKSPEASAGATPGQAALGAPSPSPKAAASSPAQQGPQTQTLDVSMINDAPYFDSTNPGCQKGVEKCRLSLPAGSILKFVNRDDQNRQFSSGEGTYDTGNIAPGGTKQLTLNSKGDFAIEDPNAPFILADLQVY